MKESERENYIRQIRRLQEQNRLLAEVIATERQLRKKAYAWYYARLNSRIFWMIDFMMMNARKQPR